MRILTTAILAVCIALMQDAVSRGQSITEQSRPSSAEGEELARILQKLAKGEQLSAVDIGKLDNAVIRVDDTRTTAGDPEFSPIEREKRIYILKVDRGEQPDRQFFQMQKALLRSQLTVLRVLAVIARHQDRLERRVARTENIQRELALGMKSMGHGVDRARLDISSTNADTTQICEMSGDISEQIKDIGKILDDVCN